jgi:glycosyltransferase involved in cell wall biosynthesis
MNILFVFDYYHPHVGGAEVIYKNYCEGLAERGNKVTVVTLNHTGKLKEKEIVKNVTVFRVRTPFNSRYLFSFLSIFKILKLAKNADIIHTAFFMSALPAIIVSKLLRKPIIVTVHEVWGNLRFFFKESVIKKIFDFLAESVYLKLPFTKFNCYSFYTFNSLRLLGVPDEKIVFIPLGIDPIFNPKVSGKKIRKELKIEKNKVYLYFGRPGVSKGVEYLIRASAIVKKRMRNSKLLLILSKDPKDGYTRVIKLIDELNLKDYILLLEEKPHEEMPKYIAASDLVVVPSLSEGFGFTAAEASAMGKAVVATYAGSLPEVVMDNVSGILVKPRSEEELANAICFLLKNEKIRKRMGKIGAKLMKKFSWKKTIDELERLYNSIAFSLKHKQGIKES